jgi:hypothetical protein
VQQTNDALSNAFQLLSSIVRDFYANGRPCLGAGLKPILYKRANFNFNEQWLGFSKFGDFLRAAQAAGHVQLSPTPGGDIGVWPVGVTIPDRPLQPASGLAQAPPGVVQPQTTTRSTAPLRVRQDLWNAFNSFTVSWVYDPVADIAQRENVIEAQGPRLDLVKIPASVSRVLEWMRSFADTQGQEIQSQMLIALNGDAAPYRFNNYVRSNRSLARAWRDFHIQKVLSAIESWASSNGLHPKNLTDPFYWSLRPSPAQTAPAAPILSSVPQAAPSTPPAAQRPSSLVDHTSLLTGRLEPLIDELIDGLLKLRGLLQVVGPK